MLRHLAQKVHFPTSSEVREVIYRARKTNTVSLPRFIVVRRGFVHDTALLPPLQEGGGMGEYVLDRVVTSCSGNMTTHFATDVSSPCPNPQPSNAVTPFFLLFIRSINNSYTPSLIYSEFICYFPFRFVFFVFLF